MLIIHMLIHHISQEGKKKNPDGVFKTAINGTPSGFIQIIPINVSCNNTPLLTLIIQTWICRLYGTPFSPYRINKKVKALHSSAFLLPMQGLPWRTFLGTSPGRFRVIDPGVKEQAPIEADATMHNVPRRPNVQNDSVLLLYNIQEKKSRLYVIPFSPSRITNKNPNLCFQPSGKRTDLRHIVFPFTYIAASGYLRED